jgi:hypothetical protein
MKNMRSVPRVLIVWRCAQVIRFKQTYFAPNGANYETALPGTLRIVPNDDLATLPQLQNPKVVLHFYDGATEARAVAFLSVEITSFTST